MQAARVVFHRASQASGFQLIGAVLSVICLAARFTSQARMRCACPTTSALRPIHREKLEISTNPMLP